MENKELVKYNEEGTNFIVNLKSASTSYCSLNVNTQKEKEHLFNIISSPTDRIANMINEIIELKDLYVETVELTNEETGEIIFAPRTILIDKNGKSFECVSIGIFSALKKLFQIFGEPCIWEKPIKIKIKQIQKGTKSILTFSILGN
nr:MAG TPA: Single stranded DNA binding protein [Caudoviricetes sp.]